MLIPFDASLLLSLLGIILIILTSLLAFGNNPLLLRLVRGIDKDLSRYNEFWLNKAHKYTHEKKLSGKKLRIRRLLGDFPDEKFAPQFVVTVAGMAVIGWVYCLFFSTVSYIYSGQENDSLIDWLLIVGQLCLVIDLVVFWFGKTFQVIYPMFFLIFSFILMLIVLIFGAVLTYTGLFFHVIPEVNVKWFYLGTLSVPFLPIVVALVEVLVYLFEELKKYKRLKKAVLDFEVYKKEGGKSAKKNCF